MRDNHIRSFIKGTTWRVIGTADTAMLAYLWTGQIGDSLKIAGGELISKILLYYVHERIWMRLKFGRKQVKMNDGSHSYAEAHWRSMVKGLSWRFFGTMDTILWAFIILNNPAKAVKIGVSELFTKVFLYYLHERVWMRIKWGTIPHNLVPKVESPGAENKLEFIQEVKKKEELELSE